jgi:hypothetical protein
MAGADRQLAAFRLDRELIAGLKAVQERDGIPQTEQVRRVLRAYLTEKGVLQETKKLRKSGK